MTAAVESYSTYQVGGVVYKINAEKIIVTGLDKNYRLLRNGGKKQFSTARQFLRLYPKLLRPQIDVFRKQNNIDFRSTSQVLALFNYAEKLD